MNFEKALFLVAAVAALGYVLVKKRPVDWFSVAAGAAAIYFLPGFFGFVSDPDLQRIMDIADETYLVFFIVFASIGLGAVWSDLILAKQNRPSSSRLLAAKHDRYTAPALIAISIISLAFAVIELGDLVLIAEKEVAMQKHGRWMIAYEFSACLGFLTFFASDDRRSSVLAGLLILPSIFFGYRTAIVMTSLGAVMIYLRGMGAVVLVRKWPLMLFAALMAYSLMYVKQIMFAFKHGVNTGNWSLLADQLQNEQLYVDAILFSEPFLVQNTLNTVVLTEFSVGIEQLESIFAVLVPFGNELGLSNKGFNDYFQPTLFSDVDFGLAANIWAQAYSLGSLGIVIVFSIFFVSLLTVINLAYFRARGSIFAAVVLSGAYWAFYIHRNDLLYQTLLQRRILLFLVIGWFISYLLSIRRIYKP